jgi:hypothetical protein
MNQELEDEVDRLAHQLMSHEHHEVRDFAILVAGLIKLYKEKKRVTQLPIKVTDT